MRSSYLGLVSWVSLVSLAACGDDGSTTSFDPTVPGTSVTMTGSAGSTGGQGGTTEPTSTSPVTEGGGTLGTEGSGGEASTGTATTASTGNVTTATTTTTDGETTTTTESTGLSGTSDSGSTGVVPCDPAMCPMGQYCDLNSNSCVPGCDDDTDCQNQTKCDVVDNTCKGCISDTDCMLGTVCEAGSCVPGCNDKQLCQDGLACCTDQCFDLLEDLGNCGGCGIPCNAFPNANPECNAGMCVLGTCKDGFNNCDQNPANGCEFNGTCKCTPGQMQACYTGPEGTAGKGICKQGVALCNAMGTGFGACMGEVLPNDIDICANNLDDNCNGVKDEDLDEDKDGYTVCKGDCCDSVGPSCLNPELVNSGAFEVMGNMVDDDCDGVKDNPVPSCDAGLPSNSADPLQYARAIDLCQFTTENAQGAQKKWGVISGTLTRANGVGAIDAAAKSIRPGFGTNVKPQQNASLAILSTGNAADQNDLNPPYVDFQTGKDNLADSQAPADWLAANGNQFPNAPGCPAAGSTDANNSAMLKLRVRVPTNAKSFNVQMYFYSAEWPEWTCTAFNDMFVTLVNSTAVGNPNDRNIAIYTTQNNQKFPVGVNLVKAAPGLFTQCKNGTFGCSGINGGNYNGCLSQTGLTGTGFDILEGGCGANNTTGGGTGWLKMSGNVKGGETMEIRFAIWDTADGIYDSLVLLDDWVWSVQASQPGVQPN